MSKDAEAVAECVVFLLEDSFCQDRGRAEADVAEAAYKESSLDQELGNQELRCLQLLVHGQTSLDAVAVQDLKLVENAEELQVPPLMDVEELKVALQTDAEALQ